MNKLILVFLLLPFTVTATNFDLNWPQYPTQYITATLNVECKLTNEVSWTPVIINLPRNLMNGKIVYDANEGETLQCRMWANNVAGESGRSGVGQATVPFLSLPPPGTPSLVVAF